VLERKKLAQLIGESFGQPRSATILCRPPRSIPLSARVALDREQVLFGIYVCDRGKLAGANTHNFAASRIAQHITGGDGQQVTYDARRLQGVSVYREAERSFAEGDRVQFTAPSKELHVANRELGTHCAPR
jgi:hypothetical protein